MQTLQDISIETLEVSDNTKKIVYWMIPETLPFNEFIKMVEEKEFIQNIEVGIEEESLRLFLKKEQKFMKLN
jgi:hypothetical protein